MGFAGHTNRKRHREQIIKALANGSTKHAPTNTQVTFDGTADSIMTFEGLFWNVTGLMTFRHYDTPVMAIDFGRDRITDFGYTRFSMTTGTNLLAWKRALEDMEFMCVTCLSCATDPFRWTLSERYNKNSIKYAFPRGAGHERDMFLRFRAGVPWVKTIDGDPWFCGRSYDENLEDRFDRIRTDILHDGVSWHWYTADWDRNGLWNKRFIDEAAEKRWSKRQAKLARAQDRVLALTYNHAKEALAS